MKTGEKIKYYRKRSLLTQTELGKMLGVKLAAVSKWECGYVENIPASKIRMMAEIFGIPPKELIDDSDDDSSLLITAEERALLETFRAAPKDIQLAVLRVLGVQPLPVTSRDGGEAHE